MTPPAAPEVITPPEPRRARWADWLLRAAGGVWLVGGIAFALLQCVRVGRMLRRLRDAKPADAAFARRVEEVAAGLRVRPVPVCVVPGVGSPLIWAFRRPQLLWPAELPPGMPAMSDDSVRGLIVHELAHVKRRDHWVGWLELLAGCAWWWNPLFWYVRHQLRENAELACDAWVVATLPKGRRAYAEGLLAVCECMSGRTAPMPAVGVGTGGRRFLERRLAMILRERAPLRLTRAGLLGIALLALTALPAWSQKPPGAAGEGGEGGAPVFERTVRTLAQDPFGGAESPRSGGYILFTADPGLPSEARELMAQLESEEAAARQEMQARVARRRQEVIQKLQALQDRYTRAGQLDEAVAVRDRVRLLQGDPRTAAGGTGATGAIRGQPDPGTLTGYRDRVGRKFLFDVVGRTEGTIWGTDIYTDDSPLAVAAVHVGVVRPGERRVVRVTILPAYVSYQGSTRNGVTSSSYGPWDGSYQIEAVEPVAGYVATGAQPDPGTLVQFRGQAGRALNFEVVGSAQGTVWGSDVYTDDSPLAAAAVHAGAVGVGQRGVVRVTILPGRDEYAGSTRNGVTTQSYGPWPGSYRVEPALRLITASTDAVNPTPSNPYNPSNPTNPPSVQSFRGQAGHTFSVELVGSTQGTVWGTDVYTDDSSLAAAAVHAGVLRDGERGTVTVTILPPRGSYAGSTRNGVNSQSWGAWGGSFRVERGAERSAGTSAEKDAAGYNLR